MNQDRIAYFVTCHGFGHATRAAAVMSAIHELVPHYRIEIFTDCPSWIFRESLQADFGYHHVQTDVGFVQRSPLAVDLPATCGALTHWLPFDSDLVKALSDQLLKQACRLVVCDISTLGIAAALEAALPCVLVESFTWEWMYRQYADVAPDLEPFARLLEDLYSRVDLRIQTEPLCRRVPAAPLLNPIYRQPRTARQIIRDRLGISPASKMVLVTMGGTPDRFEFLDTLPAGVDPFFVIPGADNRHISHPKVKLLPQLSSFYHPDLIQAADAIVGKAGYSTIAEAYHSGIPFGYMLRPGFPESDGLKRFIQKNMPAMPISDAEHHSGRWIQRLPELLALTPKPQSFENGALQTARLILDLLKQVHG